MKEDKLNKITRKDILKEVRILQESKILKVNPEDIIVLKYSKKMSQNQYEFITNLIRKELKLENKIIWLEDGLDIDILRKEVNEIKNTLVNDFAYKVATTMKDLSSSHVYFIMQQAFGEIDWNEAEDILNNIINQTKEVNNGIKGISKSTKRLSEIL